MNHLKTGVNVLSQIRIVINTCYTMSRSGAVLPIESWGGWFSGDKYLSRYPVWHLVNLEAPREKKKKKGSREQSSRFFFIY